MSNVARVVSYAAKSAQTTVVSAASFRVSQKPDLNMPEDPNHHHDHGMALPNHPVATSSTSLSRLLAGNSLRASNAFTSKLYQHLHRMSNDLTCNFNSFLSTGSVSVRGAHTDVKVPNFDEYRNSYTENANESSKVHADDKQTYSYISTFGKQMERHLSEGSEFQ